MSNIEDVAETFVDELLRKFYKKVGEGYAGWDEPTSKGDLKELLLEHVAKEDWTRGNLIDIALFCLFLWNLEVN